jgi:hypothetical protein
MSKSITSDLAGLGLKADYDKMIRLTTIIIQLHAALRWLQQQLQETLIARPSLIDRREYMLDHDGALEDHPWRRQQQH